MSYRFKGPKVIINGEIQHITPAPLPVAVEDGCFAVDSVDGKFKVYNEASNRWIILGDADDIVFDNTNTLFNSTNVEDALKEVSDVVEGNFNFSNAVGFEVFTSLDTDSTTSPTFQTKLTGTTTNSDTGTYVINWYAELTNSGNNNLNDYRVQFKRSSDSTWINACELDIAILRSEAYQIMAGFRVFTISPADTIDFRVQYRRINGTARIRNTNLYIFKVAT